MFHISQSSYKKQRAYIYIFDPCNVEELKEYHFKQPEKTITYS